MKRVNISHLCAIRADQSSGVLCHMQYIRSCYLKQIVDDTKGVIRTHKSKTERQ